MTNLNDKIRGCLVAGAIGDALGYPVEFIPSHKNIVREYGEGGIMSYDMHHPWTDDSSGSAKAVFSDDTQMTLYTAEGMLFALKYDLPIVPAIREAYLAWYGRQIGSPVKVGYQSVLAKIDELNHRRAPGNTCISALHAEAMGKVAYNDSKGCGGIMRIAPIPCYGAAHGWTLEYTARLAGDAAYITHKHPMSTLSSACAAAIMQLCLLSDDAERADGFRNIVNEALECTAKVYADSRSLDKFKTLIANVMDIDAARADWDVIEQSLGGGWVAEETLAIALFSVMRHLHSVRHTLVSAVNHGGDSDSTGAVAGNIIGAIHGYDAIPMQYKSDLQLLDIILSYADTLANVN